MTAVPPRVERFVELSPDELRFRLHEALSLYVNAMRYPKGTAEQRAPMAALAGLSEQRRGGEGALVSHAETSSLN